MLPPSTTIACPVMKSLSEEQRNTSVPIKSSGVCSRLIERSLSCSSVNAFGAFCPSCSTKPGAIALTQMP